MEPGRVNPHIASIAVATPPFVLDQARSLEHLLRHYGDKLKPRSVSLMRKIFANPGIKKRYFAIDDVDAFLSEDPDGRIARFSRWSVNLSEKAVLEALSDAGLTINSISGLVVNTCTGYICPGISTYLIEKLGLRRDIKVYDLVGSGCGGAVPNLEVARSLMTNASEDVIVSVSVEICSATFQMGDDLSLLISNALFGDGAAAAVLRGRPGGLELIESSSCYVPEDRDAIRYVHKNGHLHNQLSTNLDELVRKAVSQVTAKLLGPRSLRVEDIKHWALHTGGEKIINSIRDEIGLSETQLRATRKVLSGYGNMSSPTVWFVLKEILKEGMKEGDWCIMAAFGAGLSAHAFLLRKT
ncbi:MAG: type III polyketide synthase [Nitrospiraceae bacterium]|nr:MAG: type III polyketide synthase [Nitrospiraceae bacterium]